MIQINVASNFLSAEPNLPFLSFASYENVGWKKPQVASLCPADGPNHSDKAIIGRTFVRFMWNALGSQISMTDAAQQVFISSQFASLHGA